VSNLDYLSFAQINENVNLMEGHNYPQSCKDMKILLRTI